MATWDKIYMQRIEDSFKSLTVKAAVSNKFQPSLDIC